MRNRRRMTSPERIAVPRATPSQRWRFMFRSLLFLFLWPGLFLWWSAPAWGQGPRPATLTAVREATVVRRSLQGPLVAPVVRGLPLDNGYVLRTNPNGMAEALFRDGRHVKLDQDTALEI